MKHGRKEHPLPLCGSINFPPRGERRGRRCFEIIPGNFQFRSGFEGRRRATCSEFPLLVRAEGFRSESDQEKFSSFLTRGEGETEEACSKVGSVVWRANLVATWGGGGIFPPPNKRRRSLPFLGREDLSESCRAPPRVVTRSQRGKIEKPFDNGRCTISMAKSLYRTTM